MRVVEDAPVFAHPVGGPPRAASGTLVALRRAAVFGRKTLFNSSHDARSECRRVENVAS